MSRCIDCNSPAPDGNYFCDKCLGKGLEEAGIHLPVIPDLNKLGSNWLTDLNGPLQSLKTKDPTELN